VVDAVPRTGPTDTTCPINRRARARVRERLPKLRLGSLAPWVSVPMQHLRANPEGPGTVHVPGLGWESRDFAEIDRRQTLVPCIDAAMSRAVSRCGGRIVGPRDPQPAARGEGGDSSRTRPRILSRASPVFLGGPELSGLRRAGWNTRLHIVLLDLPHLAHPCTHWHGT
jgi:hypothetical protein